MAMASGASSARADNYVFLWNDLSDNLEGITWQNGTIIQDYFAGGESYTGSYVLWSNATLVADVSLNVNIYGGAEDGGALSDTWSIGGVAGDRALSTFNYVSDSGASPVTPLPGAINIWETGSPQTVLQLTAANGDTYTFQFQSDVPEPSTWAMMLVGFGALGFAGYRRQKAAVAA
jgi:hypothetical protein